MPRNIHNNVPPEEKRRQVLEAFKKLHAEGFEDCGLIDLARVIDLPWVRVKGEPSSGALGPYIRRLVDEGLVVRRAQGPKRGRYKLLEEI